MFGFKYRHFPLIGIEVRLSSFAGMHIVPHNPGRIFACMAESAYIYRLYNLLNSMNMEAEKHIPDWAMELNCAITVCDSEGYILYMNEKSRETYRKHGNLIGKNLMECHNERSKAIISHLLETGGQNAYTIEKEGLHKMIYQSAWKENGVVKGLCEISMVIPAEMPHYVRK